MNKFKTATILLQLCLYNSNIMHSMQRSDSFNQPKSDNNLIPRAKADNNNSNDSFPTVNSSFSLDNQPNEPIQRIENIDIHYPTENNPRRPSQLFTPESLSLTSPQNSANSSMFKNANSFFSNFFSNIHEVIAGKNFENQYWEIFNIDKILTNLKSNINDQKESQRIISNLIKDIQNQYLDAIKLTFNKYLSIDNEMMRIIEQDLETGLTIVAFPSSSSIFVTTLHTVEGNLENVVIPSQNLSAYDPNFIQDIENTWLLNLHINNLNSDFRYTHFNYLKSKFKLYSADEILTITKGLQSNIHFLYEEDLKKLKEHLFKLVPFITKKFTTEIPEIDKILVNIHTPDAAEILLKTDTPEKIKEKVINFTKKLTVVNK